MESQIQISNTEMLTRFFQEIFQNPSAENIRILIESIHLAKQNIESQSKQEYQLKISKLDEQVESLRLEKAQNEQKIAELKNELENLNGRNQLYMKKSKETFRAIRDEYNSLKTKYDELQGSFLKIKEKKRYLNIDSYAFQAPLSKAKPQKFQISK